MTTAILYFGVRNKYIHHVVHVSSLESSRNTVEPFKKNGCHRPSVTPNSTKGTPTLMHVMWYGDLVTKLSFWQTLSGWQGTHFPLHSELRTVINAASTQPSAPAWPSVHRLSLRDRDPTQLVANVMTQSKQVESSQCPIHLM